MSSSSPAKATCRCSSPRTKPTTSGSFRGSRTRAPYVKDGINDYVVHGQPGCREPGQAGHQGRGALQGHRRRRSVRGDSPAALAHALPKQEGNPFGKAFDDVFAARLREADEFYGRSRRHRVSDDAANVMRQALAGMLWSKQFFFFDGDNWLDEHNANPLHHGIATPGTRSGSTCSTRTSSRCPTSGSIPGMRPGTWPSTRSRCRSWTPTFAKEQMELMLRGSYLHPNGQMPAYEWNFSDVNPPVHAWATLFPASHRAGPARRGGPRFSRSDLQQAAAELHLVGQPQGPLRQERLRGRLPRARQHRRLRPQRPAAHRRPSRAGGRHGLDGALLPEHAGARHRARRPRSAPTRTWSSSSSSTSSGSPRP